MSDYGFDETNENFEPPVLPKRSKQVSKQTVQTAVEVGNSLGFIPRDLPNKSEHKKSDRRQVNKEPQGKILITGPERVLEQLREMSISSNQPYWKVIESLLSKDL